MAGRDEDRDRGRGIGRWRGGLGCGRRHDVTPSQLFGWMRQFRDAALALNAPVAPPMFASAVIDTPAIPSPPLAEQPAEIEISVGIATVRIRGTVDTKTLAAVLKALRVLA